MRTLYHSWLSPFCRKARIVLSEKKVEAELRIERFWERREEFLALNPAGEVPVLVQQDGPVLCGASVICEYLDETRAEPPLIGRDPEARAEVRRLVDWFDRKFNREVTRHLVGEKVIKRLTGQGEPDSRSVRAGVLNVHIHLDYIGWLSERRTWLGGDHFSLADISAAAHLSCVDYAGDIPWEDHIPAKEWYARVKSRPSFRPLLQERVPGIPPPRHYADLDF